MQKLTKKEKGFADDYLETGHGVESALKNYDTEDYNTAGAIASQNLRKLKIQAYIQDHAEDAESKIYQLSQKAKSEMVSFIASKDIMDRAGYKPVEKSLNININEQTPEQLVKANLFNEWWKKQQTA